MLVACTGSQTTQQVAQAATMSRMRFHCDSDTTAINRLLMKGYESGLTDAIHENMTYYCKTLVTEARKRGIATFVWDNNVFGNGMEKFGIFDRKNNMQLAADWTVSGIMQGIVTEIGEFSRNKEQKTMQPRKFFRNGRLLIQKDGKVYTLQGCEN